MVNGMYILQYDKEKYILYIKCFSDWYTNVKIYIDGDELKLKINKNYSSAEISLPKGRHDIIVEKSTILDSWYWWIISLNIVIILGDLRGFNNFLGYDGKYAKYNFKINLKNVNDSKLHFNLNEFEYNKRGYNGAFYKVDCIFNSNIEIIEVYRVQVPHKLIYRYRASNWLPFAFYFSLFYSYFVFHTLKYGYDNIVKSSLIAVLLSFSWLVYKIIVSYTKKNIQEIIQNNKNSEYNKNVKNKK